MRTGIGEIVRDESARRWAEYLVKAVVLLVVFFVVSQLVPSMPPICLAIVWPSGETRSSSPS